MKKDAFDEYYGSLLQNREPTTCNDADFISSYQKNPNRTEPILDMLKKNYDKIKNRMYESLSSLFYKELKIDKTININDLYSDYGSSIFICLSDVMGKYNLSDTYNQEVFLQQLEDNFTQTIKKELPNKKECLANDDSLLNHLSTNNSGTDKVYEDDTETIQKELDEKLTPLERVINRYVLAKYEWSEIAKKENISVETAIRLYIKIGKIKNKVIDS